MNVHQTKTEQVTKWDARGLIGIVLVLNLQAAFYFIFDPFPYVASFELTGIPGQSVVIGFGILFLMWQIPYVFAVIDPMQNFHSLLEAILMQTIGVIGETWLRSSIPLSYNQLRESILRFIYFDAGGLLLLLIAWGLVYLRFIKEKR